MGRYLVTSSSHFTPFTYDELAKPLQQMAEAHNAVQQEYDALSMTTESLRHYISDNPGDDKARGMYNNYVARLSELQNSLWKNGYTAQARRNLSEARAGYSSDITRIAKAVETRQERSKEYWKAKHDNPEAIMGKDPGLGGLDDYMANDLYGSDYFNLDGKTFANNLAADLKARASEMLKDPKIEQSGMAGWLRRIEKEGFTNEELNNAYNTLAALIGNDQNNVNKLDESMFNTNSPEGIIASTMLSHIKSTGAVGKIDDSEFSRLMRFARFGAAGAVGKTSVNYMQDLEWRKRMQMALQQQAHNNRMKELEWKWDHDPKNPKNIVGGPTGSMAPRLAQLRGNTLSGTSEADKKIVYDALNTLRELKKSGALRQPNGTYSDAAQEAAMAIYNSDYYKKLPKDQQKEFFKQDWDETIAALGKEVNAAVKNDHIYQFFMNNTAAANALSNTFKVNIGELSGKNGDSLAASIARYSNGKAVSAKDLQSILNDKNTEIGFNAKTGKIVIQRTGKSGDSSGMYDDRIINLNPNVVLTGTSGYANAASLMYAFNAVIPDSVPVNDRTKFENTLAAMASVGQTIDLRELANLIHNSYNSLVVNGDDADRAIFNGLVEAFAQGLFDSTNTEWSPNTYKEGWGVKTGGDYMYDDYGYYLD